MIATLGVEDHVVKQVATFQAPLRDLQVHGMALFLAIGLVTQKKDWTTWGFLLAGVLGEVALFLVYRMTENTIFAACLLLPWSFILAAVLRTTFPYKIPYAWLILSLVMLLCLPLYSLVSHQPFSHAYYGAIRHAVTVGCFSQMALLLMPMKGGVIQALSIILLNCGCFLRVAFQILTDFHSSFFALIPISGGIEFTAIVFASFALYFATFPKQTRDNIIQDNVEI